MLTTHSPPQPHCMDSCTRSTDVPHCSAHWAAHCFQIRRGVRNNWLAESPRRSGTGILALCPGAGGGAEPWEVGTVSLSCEGHSQVARETMALATGAQQPEKDLGCPRVGCAVTTRPTGLWGRLRSKWRTDHWSPPPYNFLLRPGITHTGSRHCWDAHGLPCPDPPVFSQRSA